MDGKMFRALATDAVNRVAEFMDEHPDMYCLMRIRPVNSQAVIVVGMEKDAEDEGQEVVSDAL